MMGASFAPLFATYLVNCQLQIDRIIYLIFALASITARTKAVIVAGILIARIIAVLVCPNCGIPEDNSNTQPTLAIAVIQERSSKTLLLGVIYIINIR